jgi:hypothetical protein
MDAHPIHIVISWSGNLINHCSDIDLRKMGKCQYWSRIYLYIPVYTGIYLVHILSSTSFTLNQALPALRHRCFSAARSLLASPAATCLWNVFSTLTLPKRGLPRAKLHSHRLTSHRHRCPAFRQQELRRHSHAGSLNPCACVGSSESSFLLEKGT